jgi:hypothetical protein
MGSSPGRVKPKTIIKLVLVASPLGEHANHYATKADWWIEKLLFFEFKR